MFASFRLSCQLAAHTALLVNFFRLALHQLQDFVLRDLLASPAETDRHKIVVAPTLFLKSAAFESLPALFLLIKTVSTVLASFVIELCGDRTYNNLFESFLRFLMA
jgi:hypothetical protein